jgi:hypothetical protein
VTFSWAVNKEARRRLRLRRRVPTRQPLGREDLQRRHRPGKRHPHATRILARAWLGVIWRCWHDHTTYNPDQHGALQALLNAPEAA